MSLGNGKLKQQWDITMPIRMHKIQKTDNIKNWQGWEATEACINCWWECKMAQPLWKTVWQYLIKLTIILSYYPAIMFLGIYPKDVKSCVYTRTCPWIFVAALFTVAKNWKQQRCPSINRYTNSDTPTQYKIIKW